MKYHSWSHKSVLYCFITLLVYATITVVATREDIDVCTAPKGVLSRTTDDKYTKIWVLRQGNCTKRGFVKMKMISGSVETVSDAETCSASVNISGLGIENSDVCDEIETIRCYRFRSFVAHITETGETCVDKTSTEESVFPVLVEYTFRYRSFYIDTRAVAGPFMRLEYEYIQLETPRATSHAFTEPASTLDTTVESDTTTTKSQSSTQLSVPPQRVTTGLFASRTTNRGCGIVGAKNQQIFPTSFQILAIVFGILLMLTLIGFTLITTRYCRAVKELKGSRSHREAGSEASQANDWNRQRNASSEREVVMNQLYEM